MQRLCSMQRTAGTSSGAAASTSASAMSLCPRAPPARLQRGSLQRMHAEKDPEGMFKGIPLQKGIIEKRLAAKEMKKSNKDYDRVMKFARDEVERETITRREARTPPTDHDELIEYFLNTLAPDMEFEVARCRPMLSPEFFKALDKQIGQARFAGGPDLPPDEERVAELDMLRQYLAAASQAVDAAIAATTSAKERMKKLLTSKDKKECILQMAEANELDQALLDLLKSNAQAAREAGQMDAANFMEKVAVACAKYVVTGAPAVADAATVMPALPQFGKAKAAEATTPSGLILPGSASSSSSPSAPAKDAPSMGSVVPPGNLRNLKL